jgi:hypothetical protein
VTKLPFNRVTGAGASPDGNSVAVRTNRELFLYRTQELVGGSNAQPRRFDLTTVREPQGEGVAMAADGVIYLAGEGGGGGGTLATIRCTVR